MELPETLAKRWDDVVEHVGYAPPWYAPLRFLVEELAQSGAAPFAWPATSHFNPWFTSVDYRHRPCDVHSLPAVGVEYWPQVDKFLIRFYRFQGVAFDQKWCDLPEAAATLKWAFRRLKLGTEAAGTGQ